MPIYSLIFTLFPSFPLMVYILHAMQNYSKQKMTKINHYSSTWKISAPPFQPRQILNIILSIPALPTINQRRPRKTRMVNNRLFLYPIHLVARFLNSKNDDSSDRMQSYIDIISIYGKEVGIGFNFQGTVANILDAHRLIQHFQEEHGPDTAEKMVDGTFFISYFFPFLRPFSKTLMSSPSSIALYESYHPLSLNTPEPSTL